MRRVGVTFAKNNVSSGELLVLKSTKDLTQGEKFKMSVHLTSSGLSDDSNFIDDIEVPRDLTLDELKDQILDMPLMSNYCANVENGDFIRLREKQ